MAINIAAKMMRHLCSKEKDRFACKFTRAFDLMRRPTELPGRSGGVFVGPPPAPAAPVCKSRGLDCYKKHGRVDKYVKRETQIILDKELSMLGDAASLQASLLHTDSEINRVVLSSFLKSSLEFLENIRSH